MFGHLDRLPADPILGVMSAYRADEDPRKVDLGVGVYCDDRGVTPILPSVRQAEQAVLARQTTKTYVAPVGDVRFNQAMEKLVFGEGHAAAAAGRICTVQTPGGSGALRVAAELIRIAAPSAAIHVSTPTWANHTPLLTGAGLKLQNYPYFDPATGGVQFDAMVATLETLSAGSIVLLHASCHNPTGADLSEAQWRQLLELFKRRGLSAFIDMAYQGLGSGLAEDAFGVRLFAAELPELIVAVSCSKNFGLYRERVGALHIVNESASAASSVITQMVRIVRTLYSMPPDHGAAIVHEILATDSLRQMWMAEADAMRTRITSLREAFVTKLAQTCPARDFGFISKQRGMFSRLPVTVEQARELRGKHHIYLLDDGRINIAGLRHENLDYVAQAVAKVLLP